MGVITVRGHTGVWMLDDPFRREDMYTIGGSYIQSTLRFLTGRFARGQQLLPANRDAHWGKGASGTDSLEGVAQL